MRSSRLALALFLATTLGIGTCQAARSLVFFREASGSRRAIEAVSGDRAAVQAALIERAARARSRFMALRAASATDRVLWIANAVAIDLNDADRAASHPDVLRVEPVVEVALDRIVEAEAPFRGDDDASTWGLKAIHALEARETHQVDGTGVVVGILDTGIDAAHPDLLGRLGAFKDFVSGQPEAYDDNGHGTHCAGTIAGGASTGRALGVAPGATLVAGKIFSKGGMTTTERILAGMQWIVDPDGTPASGDEPRLVSNSWSSPPGTMTYLEAVRSWLTLDIVPVFAASNSGPKPETIRTPGGYPESLAVGASTVDTEIASFSSRGPVVWDGVEIIKPDVSAPGKAVYSAWPGGGHKLLNGTSMATPHVAGIAALIRQAAPDASAAEVRQALEATAVDHGPLGKDNDWGHGLVDALAAIAVAKQGGELTGRVLDGSSNPISWAKVSLGSTRRPLLLGPDGSFRALVAAGEYSLAVEAFGFEARVVPAVVVPASGTEHLLVTLERTASGTVRGVLIGEEGAPLEGWVGVVGAGMPPVPTDAGGHFEMLLPAGTHTLSFQSYGYSAGEMAELVVTAGHEHDLSVTLARPPPILVVDDDGGQGFEAWWITALDDLGEDHQVVEHSALQGLTGRYLAQFETVLWLTGKDNKDVLDRHDQKAIAEYLDLGGRLLLSGQEVGFTMGESLFFRNRLKSVFVSDGTTVKTVSGAGLALDIKGGDGANNQIFPDAVEAAANSGAETFLTYGNGDGAGVRASEGNSRLVYLGFGIEGVSTAEGRAALMSVCLSYLRPGATGFAARLDAVDLVRPQDEADAIDLGRLGVALGDLVGLRFPSEVLNLEASRTMERARLFRSRGEH